MKKLISLFLLAVVSFAAFAWLGVRIYRGYDFSISCTGHLKRAADANTVEIAKAELNTAIAYLEKEDLTTGTVSIFLKQPKNDIGFWYGNLTASRDELNNISPSSSQLEKTNVLMKLRETLTDTGKESTTVTCPDGISVYPANALYFWWGLLSWLLILPLGIWVMVEFDLRYY